MSQEVSQENLPSDSSREVLKVTLLGGGWNSSAGGLATFNRELAIHLSQRPKVEVSFLVPDGHCTDEDKREAQNYGIAVVGAKNRTGYDPLDWLIAPPESHQMDVVVGHGAKLGKQVQFIKESARFHQCKWVQVVHTAPEDLSKYKGYPDPISKGEEKHEVEVDLCKSADLVVPVGPRLEEAYSSYLQRCKSHQDVLTVIPGLFDREFGDLEQSPNENAEFKVLLCGRGDEEDFELKGYDIAVKAFTDHRLKGKRYHLIFVGAPEGKQDEVRKRLLQGGITDDQLTVRKFIQSREKMKDLLCEVDLVIMPSKSEGYGLVALEALSAGLPILVSSRAGFARALKNIPIGESCIVDSCDPAKWAEAIEGVGVRHSMRLEEMKLLREFYGRRYSWKKQCENLVEKLWTMINGEKLLQMSNEMNDLKEKQGSHLQNTGTEIKGHEISQKLDQMRTNIETVRKESKVQVDISAKLEQMRLSEIESVRKEVDAFFRTTTEEIREEGSSVMDIQQNVHPAEKCRKIDDVEATGGQSTSSDRKQLQAAIRSMKANIKTETEQSTDVQQPWCNLGPVECIAITDFVANSNREPECLNLSNNDLGSLGCRGICDLVKDVNCNLTRLDLSFNNIGDQGAAHLCVALKDVNCSLTTLDLSYQNNIGDQGAAYLCDALKHVNCNLETLSLGDNKIGEQGAAHLCDALKDVNCNLTTLYLGGNKIGEQGAAHLCDALKDENCNLETLDLSSNKIGNQGAAYLCDALKDENCNLTTLNLSCNKVGKKAAAHLSNVLQDVNCKLTTLDLSFNKIGDQGAAYLCDALKHVNCKLTTLDLSGNNIGEQGAAHLCDALKHVNCNLATLDLQFNNIGEHVQAQLSDSLRDVNCTVRW